MGSLRSAGCLVMSGILVVALAACGTSDDGANEGRTVTTVEQATTTSSGSAGRPADDPFGDVPIAEDVFLEGESGTTERQCRTYDSAAPPATVITVLAEGLADAGWEVGETFSTGPLYDATAGVAAGKDSRELEATASGTGSNRSTMSICIAAGEALGATSDGA